jgi:tetratricopeptide (TPR) repeat protein
MKKIIGLFLLPVISACNASTRPTSSVAELLPPTITPNVATVVAPGGGTPVFITQEGSSNEVVEIETASPVEGANSDKALYYAELGLELGHSAAIESFSKALELDPKMAWVWSERGWRYFELGDYSAAINDFNQAIQQDPREERAYDGLGHVYRELGEYDKAVDHLLKAVQINPDNWGLYCVRGEIYAYNIGDLNKALQDLNQCVEVAKRAEPGNDSPYFMRGIFYREQGNWQKALDDLSEAATRAPNWPDVYGHRGEVYIELGNTDAARKDLERFLALTEGNADYTDWRNFAKNWLDTH